MSREERIEFSTAFSVLVRPISGDQDQKKIVHKVYNVVTRQQGWAFAKYQIKGNGDLSDWVSRPLPAMRTWSALFAFLFPSLTLQVHVSIHEKLLIVVRVEMKTPSAS